MQPPLQHRLLNPWSIQMARPIPNLFIIGAMKCGTTSLHTYLGTHPQIFMSDPKEPFFFSRESNWSKGDKSYVKLFAKGRDAVIRGEASIEYAAAPEFSGVPQRIFKFNPEARFIYVMRDPIERTISHYWHRVRFHDEKRDMLTAIRSYPLYLNVSHYAMQLRLYFDLFGSGRVYALTSEEMSRDPLKVTRNIFQWLGVDSSFQPPNLQRRLNVTPQYVRKEEIPGLSPAPSRMARGWEVAKDLLPMRLRLLGSKMLHRAPVELPVEQAPGTGIDRISVSVDAVAEFLRPIQLEQTQTLNTMLGRQFTEWKTLFGTKSIPASVNEDNNRDSR